MNNPQCLINGEPNPDVEHRVHTKVMDLLTAGATLDAIWWSLDGDELMYFSEHVRPILEKVN